MADFGCKLCEGSRPWNSRIEFSSVLTAAPSLFLLRASRSSSTINNSRTTRSTANSARQSVRGERKGCAPRRGQPAQSAARRRLSPSSRPRGGQCYAGRVSKSNRPSLSLRRNLRRYQNQPKRRTSKQSQTFEGKSGRRTCVAGGRDSTNNRTMHRFRPLSCRRFARETSSGQARLSARWPMSRR